MNLMNNEKHYNTLNNYYKALYNRKVCKIALNGGFSCPNKDGSKGRHGCTYCSISGSGDFAGKLTDSLEVQFKKNRDVMENKWPNSFYIPYLQANTNTYAPLKVLKEIYEKIAYIDKNVVMISIATRSDAISPETLEYLAELNTRVKVQIELGLQTIWPKTAELINRGHDLESVVSMTKKLQDRNIEVVLHIINGLPGETKEMMIETAKFVNKLNPNGVKIHSLTILKNTKMGNDYLEKPFPLLTRSEYVDITVNQIRYLNKDIIIHRLSADAPKNDLIAPDWTKIKILAMNEIDKLMRKNNYYQGDLVIKKNDQS